MFVLPLLVFLAITNVCVLGQGSLPFEVNSRETCASQISIDTATLSGVKRGDGNAPCSGYLKYTDGGNTRLMCDGSWYMNGFPDVVAQRACYTKGANFYRDTTVFDSSRTRQMMLYECFSYQEQGVETVESNNDREAWDLSYAILDRIGTGCTDQNVDADAYDCFDTCYFTDPDYPNRQFASTEDGCGEGTTFFSLGCSDINECLNGVRDYCTGPFDGSCTIRKACGNNTDCTNHVGSFECSCKNGFEYRSGDSFNPYDLNEGCKDIDECKDSRCDVNAKCVNTVGSYLCSCNDGFMGDGKTCTPITCNPLPNLPNTRYKYPLSSHNFGDTVVCECDAGYKVSMQNLPESLVNYYGYSTTDSFALTCDANGDWGPYPIPQCIPVDCGDPGVIPYAVRDGTGFRLNQAVTYTCEEGFGPQKYDSIRSFTKECQADGTWTEGTNCDDVDECQQGDVCKDDQYCINIKGSFLCMTGTPDNCDVEGFCKNGECELKNSRAECVCDEGFSGLRCETPFMSLALIMAIVGLVISGLLVIILVVVLCMLCSPHRKTVPVSFPPNILSPVPVGGTPFPVAAHGFRCPPFAIAPKPRYGNY